MPRVAVEDNDRMSLRVSAEDKALSAARSVIEKAEHVQLSGRDSLRVLELLENPPRPKAKLLAAAKALPRRK